MGRAPCCDKTKVKRGPWSPEEDNILKNYLENYGSGGNWIALPQKAGLKRCGKSCRLRWLNYLRPNIKHGGFTEEEDNIILTLYSSIGSRWSVIASQLPGRTDNDVKNYWNTKLKKKLSSAAQKATLSITTTNLFITSTNNYNPVPSEASSVETVSNRSSNYSIDNNIRPNNIFSYLPMHVAADQTPLPGLMEAPENLENPYSSGLFPLAPVSQEAVSNISPSFSLDNNATSASWSTNGSSEDDTFLAELLGSGLMPYDILNAFDFEEKLTDQINYHPSFSYSSESISTTEVQQQQQHIFRDSL